MKTTLFLLGMSFMILTKSLSAQSIDHDHQDIKQEAHLHGVASLTLAIEGDLLELNFESPAANIVGFEHIASTPEQIKAVEASKNMLETPKKLFKFVGTDCQVEQFNVDVSSVLKDKDDHHDQEEHKGDHHEEDNHKESHDHDTHQDTHSEITASYRFACIKGSTLSSISLEFLSVFKGIEKLNTQWVTEAGQGGAELSAESKIIELR
jgi:hypothetical protein